MMVRRTQWLLTLVLIQISSASPKTPKSECLPTSLDLKQFHCAKVESQYVCEDEHKECNDWARRGECKANPQYMKLSCRKSCQTCLSLQVNPIQIVNSTEFVQRVAQQMQETRQYIHKMAEKNVKFLSTCVNRNELCSQWAAQHKCKEVKHQCKAACRACV